MMSVQVRDMHPPRFSRLHPLCANPPGSGRKPYHLWNRPEHFYG